MSNGNQGAHCGPAKCGGLRRLPGAHSGEEDPKVFTLFLLRLHRVVFQTQARVSSLQHLLRGTHGEPAGGHHDGDAQLAAPTWLRALWVHRDPVRFPSRDTRGELQQTNTHTERERKDFRGYLLTEVVLQ